MYEEQAAPPVAATTWCEWHGDYTTTGQLITVIEQGSGPGAAVYACEQCRRSYGLHPD